ncbi:MAG: hypothetical protein ACK6D3_04355 [Planctomycetaceae bacterium]|jgi:hypothetical protein
MSSQQPAVASTVPVTGTPGSLCAESLATSLTEGSASASHAVPPPHFPLDAFPPGQIPADLAAQSPQQSQREESGLHGACLALGETITPSKDVEESASTIVDGPIPVGTSDDPLVPVATSAHTDQLVWYLQEQYLELDRREQLLQTQLTQFDNERRQFRLLASQRELELAEREAVVERERSELDQRQQQVTATEASQHELQVVLLRERRDLQEEREQFAADQAAIRGALAEEVQATHVRLDHEREEAAADVARIREELQRDQQLSESRLRFREEHLQRTMREFEQNQLEFRVEQQQGRTRLAETESQLLLRRQQLDGIRHSLEAHEDSLERDRQWLQIERRGIEARLQQDRERLRSEQHDWTVSRAEQQADLARKQEQLRLHAAALETRRQQLEELRRDVERTHGESLELRLAVEEAYAQLTRTVGEEATRERVEHARLLLAEHYRNSRDTLAIHSQELEQLQARLAKERSDLLFERQALAEWIATQEQLLATRAAGLDRDHAALQERELAWRQAEDRWHGERQQAEVIIRDLLRQRDTGAGKSSSQG